MSAVPVRPSPAARRHARHVAAAPAGVAILAAAILAAAGCTEKLVDTTAPPPPPPTADAVPDSVQQVFTGHCAFAGCHGAASPALGLDMSDAVTSYANLVGVHSVQRSQFLRIAPGDSANSYVVMKLRNDPRKGGQPMPFGAFPLEGSLTLRIARWAQQGALPVQVVTAGAAAPLATR